MTTPRQILGCKCVSVLSDKYPDVSRDIIKNSCELAYVVDIERVRVMFAVYQYKNAMPGDRASGKDVDLPVLTGAVACNSDIAFEFQIWILFGQRLEDEILVLFSFGVILRWHLLPLVNQDAFSRGRLTASR